jgi:hypothetical protein
LVDLWIIYVGGAASEYRQEKRADESNAKATFHFEYAPLQTAWLPIDAYQSKTSASLFKCAPRRIFSALPRQCKSRSAWAISFRCGQHALVQRPNT